MDRTAINMKMIEEEMKTNVALINQRMDSLELKLQSDIAEGPVHTESLTKKKDDVIIRAAFEGEKKFVRKMLNLYERRFSAFQHILKDQISLINQTVETTNEKIKRDHENNTRVLNNAIDFLNENVETSKEHLERHSEETTLFINNSFKAYKSESETKIQDEIRMFNTAMDKHMTAHNKLNEMIDKVDTNALRKIESVEEQLNRTVDRIITIESKMIDGGFSYWTTWGECSQTCGAGTKTRTRSCTNPSPQYNGLDCSGETTDTASCQETECPSADCSELKLHHPDAHDGVYEVTLWKTKRTVQVYCDMTTDGGGWTVFQNRYDGSVDFYRSYSQYEDGFGDLHTEFWLGLNYTEEMTSQTEEYELRIDLMSANGTTAYEVFSPFSLSTPNYVLNVGNTTSSYNIDTTHSMRQFVYHNGWGFSTRDHDVDGYSWMNCASYCRGGWWYRNRGCYAANLNGEYLTPGSSVLTGIQYESFIFRSSLKQTRMSFRATST